MNAEYCKSVKAGLVDDNGVIKLEFIKNNKYPQILASEMSKTTPKLSSKQARSFYNVVNKIYLDVIGGRLSMSEAMVELTMLSSRVNDKLNKGSVPVEFKEFIEANIDVINDVNTLKAFVLHFEAICNNLKDAGNGGNSANHGNNSRGNGNGGRAGTTSKPNGYKGNDNRNNHGGQKRW